MRTSAPDGATSHPGIGWEYGGYYLDIPHPDRGSIWYACRYNSKTRTVRRRSLRTTSFEQAQSKLIDLVAASARPVEETPHPRLVVTTHVMDAYLAAHGTEIRSEDQAIRAGALVAQYLTDIIKDPTTPLTFWTPSQQKAFGEWLRDEFQHKASTIERVFSVIAAAFNDAARVKLRLDPLGDVIEGALVSHVPEITMRRATIAKELKIDPPKKGGFTPSLEQMAKFIDSVDARHLQRWIILALNTWARPEAISDFEPWKQFDPITGLLDLNPPGRVQTNKYRPTIVATEGIRDWLPVWAAQDLARETQQRGSPPNEPIAILIYKRRRVKTVKKAILRTGDSIGLPEFTPYSLRRFMASSVRRMCSMIPRERRSMWLGHSVEDGSRTTDHYEAFDPDVLRDVALATDFVISELQKLCKRPLFAIEMRLNQSELRRIGATPKTANALKDRTLDGGRDRDRTCDPSRVNEVPGVVPLDFKRKMP